MEFNDIKYEVIKEEKDAIDIELLKDKITDYFKAYDYIVGDWAYGKVRLKGFCDKDNKLYKPLNDYDKVNDYIEEKCAHGCKYFIIKKIDK